MTKMMNCDNTFVLYIVDPPQSLVISDNGVVIYDCAHTRTNPGHVWTIHAQD